MDIENKVYTFPNNEHDKISFKCFYHGSCDTYHQCLNPNKAVRSQDCAVIYTMKEAKSKNLIEYELGKDRKIKQYTIQKEIIHD